MVIINNAVIASITKYRFRITDFIHHIPVYYAFCNTNDRIPPSSRLQNSDSNYASAPSIRHAAMREKIEQARASRYSSIEYHSIL